jgi:transaldolase
MNPIQELRQAGVSIWLDTLSRDLLETGEFERYVRQYGVTGTTSNPTIFEKALAGSDRYDLEGAGSSRSVYFDLALGDVRGAAELLRPVYEASGGADGFVSFQVTPDLADDPAGTVDQGLAVWRRLALPNVMIKVPATSAGPEAIEELTFLGVNVNVTLLFSVRRYEQVIEAYLRGLERRLEKGLPLTGIASVASFFVSRIDAKVDRLLPEGSPLRGSVAIANARYAYGLQRRLFQGERWARLEAAGARPQRPLWASTATKDPSYPDVLYVEKLATPGAVVTIPEDTLRAFMDHGRVGPSAHKGFEWVCAEAAAEAIDLDRITAELEREGVEAFAASYERVLSHIESSRLALAA